MSYLNKRSEALRLPVSDDCRGVGVNLRSGRTLEYRGVDVSVHGFGCIVTVDCLPGDALSLEFVGQKYVFQVMWSESHLGILNQLRVGLFLLDAHINLEEILRVNGLVRKQQV